MANDFTGNPWQVDTAAVLTTERVRVRGIRWVGGTTAGHTAVIKDNKSDTVWSSVAAGANNVESDLFADRGMNFDGLNVTTIASGVLYIELA